MSQSYDQVFARVSENIEIGLMLLDVDLNVLAMNKWLIKHSELDRAAVIGRPVTEIFQLEQDSRFIHSCEQTLALGTPTVLSNRLNPVMLPLYQVGQAGNPDAKICQSISLKRIKEGEQSYCTVQIEDVTSTVRREQTLKHLAEENELARIRAERDSQIKSDFLATMSHEIRTPMNGVIGMLGLLTGTELTKRQEHFVTLASSSANSLLLIINDILDFSKIEADRMEIDEFEFDLESLITEIAQGQVLRAREKDLELILDIGDLSRRFITADPGRLRQILNNLLGNAIKFTESGEVAIKAYFTGEENDLTLHCDVIDTGIGIPAGKIDQLFEPFLQQDATTTRKYGGTGLGLAIARKLCRLMDGELTCTSQEGVGSTFSFHVAVKPASAETMLTMPTPEIAGLKVLIVDDNQTNLIALENQLKQWQVHVESALSGDEALQLLADRGPGHYQMAILDMQMPQMDGGMLAKKIKAQPQQADLALIMLTSMTSRGDAAYFADLGFSGYLPKPAAPEALRDTLRIITDAGDALARAKPLVTGHHISSVRKHRSEVTRKILIAEDNAINRELIDAMLCDDFNLHFAADGNEALQTIRAEQDTDPFDLVIMDCRMPDMDGYEATRAIRAGLLGITQTSLPIIALTANAMPLDKKACFDAGMNDYLTKPIDPDLLSERLEFWLTSPSHSTHSSV
jgi:signal transduction histidine kinase/DNA-binding response OmpR family regulator